MTALETGAPRSSVKRRRRASDTIPFNRPYMTGRELSNIAQAHASGHLCGDGQFSQHCHEWLAARTGVARALLTHSCTAALEMGAMLAGVGPGDEVILPSFTFVSTANAFANRGATPVFVDIRPDTLNLDERLIEAAITDRTRIIVPVHYAGVACEMDPILALAHRHGLLVIEDAAQALLSRYRGRPLGGLGSLGALSFHETKNIIAGEGGALLIRDTDLIERAEILREKGTDRSRFFRGEVDRYTWVDEGSSFLPGEIVAAFLSAQIDDASTITSRRAALWHTYHDALAIGEREGLFRRPIVPPHCDHNAHLYYLLMPSPKARERFMASMRAAGIHTVFHYVPLHSSPKGQRVGRTCGAMTNTDSVSACLVRLPLWLGIEEHQPRVIDEVLRCARAALASGLAHR